MKIHKSLIVNLESVFRRFKLRTWIALGVIVILLPIVGLALYKPADTKAEWFNDSWQYRQRVNFGNTGAADANKKVKFDVDTATLTTDKLQADCDDIRFTDINGDLLRFFLDSGVGACDTASSDYYVLVPTINSGDTALFMYYGNPSASSGLEAAQFSEATFTPTSGPTFGSETRGEAPQLYFPMDEGVDNTCSGGTNDVCDSTINNNNGAITNGTAWQTDDKCIAGKCLWFDGTDDVVTVTQAAQINLNQNLLSGFTISAWIRPNGAGEGSGGQIFYKGSGAGSESWLRVDTLSGGNLDIQALVNMATDATLNVSARVKDNAWNHVALSYNDDGDDEITIWVNGVNLGTSIDGVGPLDTDTNNLLIGGTTTDNFKGFIDDFKIHKQEKTSAQIKAEFAAEGASRGVSARFGQIDTAFLNDGLVGYWRMEEASDATRDDSSGNGNTMTESAADTIVQATGKFGFAGDFELADTEYLSAADSVSLSVTGSLTLSAWINPETVSAGSYNIIAKWDGANVSYRLFQNGDEIRLELDSASNYQETTASNLAASTWYHVVGVYNSGDPTAKIYINGTEAASSTTGTIPSSIGDDAGVLALGAQDTSTTPTGYYDGVIDEARVYNRALSTREVRQLADWAPGPLAHWKLDEASWTNDCTSDTVFDSSGNAFNGDACPASTGPTGGVQGKFGKAGDFDGSDDRIQADPTDLLDLPGPLTLEAWFNLDSIASTIAIAGKDGATGNQGYVLRFNPSSERLNAYLSSDGTTLTQLNSTTTGLTINTWYHGTMVYDGSNLILYLNGVFNGSIAFTGNVFASSTDFDIGARNNNAQFFNGKIDDVRLYNYARTAAQVVEDMNAGHPTGGSPIGSQTAYWGFDEQYGSTVQNRVSSQTALTGTITGALWTLKENCKVNGCLNYDGTDDVTTVTNANAIDFDTGLNSGVTFSAWVKPDTVGEGSAGQIFAKSAATYCQLGGSDPFNITCSLDLTTAATVTVNSVIPTTSWTHVAMTWTNDADDEITVWINGVSRGSSTNGVGPVTADTSTLVIGGRTTNNFDGKIDEFQVYNSELTSDQMKIIYNQGGVLNLSTSYDEATQVADGAGTGPSSWWKLDEKTGTTANDSGDKDNTGTLGGGAEWAQGKYGGGLFTDAADEHVSLSDPADGSLDFGLTDSFTLSAWAKAPIGSAGSRYIINKDFSNPAGYRMRDNSLGVASCDIEDDTGATQTNVSGGADIRDNRWHNIICVRNTTLDTFVLYVDGIVVDSTTDNSDSTLNNSGTFRISGTSTSPWIGEIDEVKVFRYAMTSAQTAYEFNRGRPLSWWKLDDCTGITAYDNSGVLTNNGTVTFGSLGNTAAGTCNSGVSTEMWNNGTTGKRNASLDFDGDDDWVDMNDTDTLDVDSTNSGDYLVDFTISGWFNRDTATTTDTIVAKRNGILDTNNGYIIYLDAATDQLIFEISDNQDTDEYSMTSTTTFTTTGWHHFTVVWDDDSAANSKIYIDGKDDNETHAGIIGNMGRANNPDDFRIGSESDNGNPFDGKIDDIRVYGYPLSDTQQKKLLDDDASARFGPDTGSP